MLSSRSFAFIIYVGALGNVLAAITIAPTIVQQVALLFIPIVSLSFVSESLWIALVLLFFVPLLIPSQAFLSAFLVSILAKAWFEVCVMAFFMSALTGHDGFKAFVHGYLKRARGGDESGGH